MSRAGTRVAAVVRKPTTLWDGLIEYLPLNEASDGSGAVERVGLHLGTRWTDNNTTPSGAGRVYAASAEFTQANAESLSRTDYRLHFTGTFTCAAWVRRLESDLAGYRGIVEAESGSNGYNLFLTQNSSLVSDLNGANYHNADVGGAALVTGTWHLVRCWYDAAAGTWNNQLDLGPVGSWVVGAPTRTTTCEVRIGRQGADKYWGGNIGPVMWWNRVLTPSEWAELYNAGYGVPYGGNGVGPTWKPTDFAGCQLWLDANDIDGTGNLNQGLADNAAVSSWADKSGNGRTLTQGSAGAQPAFRTAAATAVGSKTYMGSLQFFADDFVSRNTNLLTGHTGTVIAALKMINLGGNQTLFSVADEGAWGHWWLLSPYWDASQNSISVQQYNSSGNADYLTGSTPTAGSTPYVMVWSSNGSAYSFRINGAAQTVGVVQGSNSGDWIDDVTGVDNVTVGALLDNAVNDYLRAYVGELIYYNSALSAADIARVEAYLADKWGITLA